MPRDREYSISADEYFKAVEERQDIGEVNPYPSPQELLREINKYKSSQRKNEVKYRSWEGGLERIVASQAMSLVDLGPSTLQMPGGMEEEDKVSRDVRLFEERGKL